jgi:hypothetical protein
MTQAKQTIILNGRRYNAATGELVPGSHRPSTHKSAPETQLTQQVPKRAGKVMSDVGPVARSAKRTPAPHLKKNRPQRSTTLHRAVVASPTGGKTQKSAHSIHRNIQRSRRIARFAPHSPAIKTGESTDRHLEKQAHIAHKAHAHHIMQQEIAKKPISSRAVKEHLLAKHIEQATPDHAPVEHHKRNVFYRHTRIASFVVGTLSLFIFGAYLTYSNIPNLSVQVASMNAGIEADLPRYKPSGYSINGPITYTQGEVSVNYQQTGGDAFYTLTQRSSDWDPQATLANYVEPESNNDYQIHSTQGLTVYTYDKKAVWVNGGILHIIDGTAKLSAQQIERIAASM